MSQATLIRKKLIRKPVSDEQMERALANSDNANIIRSVLQKFAGQLHEDDLYTCGLHALWRALQYHDDSYGQKFTTSLYKFTDWECKRELRRQKNEKKNMVPLATEGEIVLMPQVPEDDHRDTMRQVQECMRSLPLPDQKLLQAYYIDQFTMDEIAALFDLSKEGVRQKLEDTVKKLRNYCTRNAEEIEILRKNGESGDDLAWPVV